MVHTLLNSILKNSIPFRFFIFESKTIEFLKNALFFAHVSLHIELLSLKHEQLLNASIDDFYYNIGLNGENATMAADVGG